MQLHGANPENLYSYFNIKLPEKILDFSTNTNILKHDITLENSRFNYLISNYPDYECLELRKIISERENIPLKNILFTNGINEAIFLLSRVLESKTAILQPNYTEYKRAFKNASDIFNLDESADFNNVIISNPCNPTGFFINNLYDFTKTFQNTNFIIDESYIDFLLYSEREKFKLSKNIIILKSLTKIFHLSGVRIGYVIAPEEIISSLKNQQPSWSVNSIAQELAKIFLRDENFYSKTRDFYKKNTPEFKSLIKNYGFKISDSSVHYFLIRVNNDFNIIKKLLLNGIAVRHTRNFPGLNGNYIRVATRFKDENIFFAESLREKML